MRSGGDDLREIFGDLVPDGGDEGIVGVFDGAAENEDGTDAANVEQRRQVKRSVMRIPAARPVKTAPSWRWKSVSTLMSLARRNGKASCTPTPSATPRRPPTRPRKSVCSR